MTELATTGLWTVAIGCGVMAGIYFAFSAFVMSSLGAIAKPQGIAAMQSINREILSSPFILLFWATSLGAVVLAILGVARFGDPGALSLTIGGLVYVVGMFVCTAALNVPLNNALDVVDPTTPEAATVWSDYQRSWTQWNHVRTASSVAACALFIAAAVALQ